NQVNVRWSSLPSKSVGGAAVPPHTRQVDDNATEILLRCVNYNDFSLRKYRGQKSTATATRISTRTVNTTRNPGILGIGFLIAPKLASVILLGHVVNRPEIVCSVARSEPGRVEAHCAYPESWTSTCIGWLRMSI
ncbi:MAG: hypothetical protein O3B13_18070, partial [Planctomycetota bacterium]|nr:hypothetical protein [Planctomycetota bacterium]